MRGIAVFLLSLFLVPALFAQTYLDVQPGYGSLDSAITAHQGNVIYRLQAGGWYVLNGMIENDGFPLTIVGTTPASGQMPAVIQTGTNPDGTVLNNMFTVRGNISLRNVFIVNANANEAEGYTLFEANSPTQTRIALDSVTIDPVGGNSCMQFDNTPYPKVFLTNSLFLRQGTTVTPFDGWFFRFNSGPSNNGFDTLYVENNTFCSMPLGMGWSASATSPGDSDTFIWINHNDFIFAKQWMYTGMGMMGYYITNNLFVDFNTMPVLLAWNSGWADRDTTHYPSIILQDTMASDWQNGKVLSSRKLFLEYNSYYLDPRIQDIVSTWQDSHTKNNDGVTPLPHAYFMPLAYPPDSAKVNLLSSMWDNPSFPYFMFGHYFDNSGDPQFNDPKLYAFQDSLANWALAVSELYVYGFSANNVNSSLSNWYVNEDATYNWGNPEVWPRLNASYKNPALLNASIEGLPLGDLNWFPAQKVIWEQNKAKIMQHILNEDTTQMSITAIKQEVNQTPTEFALSQNYPNPFNPSTEIMYSVPNNGFVSLKVYDVLGQRVATLFSGVRPAGNYTAIFQGERFASGVYFYRLDAGNVSITKKMILMK